MDIIVEHVYTSATLKELKDVVLSALHSFQTFQQLPAGIEVFWDTRQPYFTQLDAKHPRYGQLTRDVRVDAQEGGCERKGLHSVICDLDPPDVWELLDEHFVTAVTAFIRPLAVKHQGGDGGDAKGIRE